MLRAESSAGAAVGFLAGSEAWADLAPPIVRGSWQPSGVGWTAFLGTVCSLVAIKPMERYRKWLESLASPLDSLGGESIV